MIDMMAEIKRKGKMQMENNLTREQKLNWQRISLLSTVALIRPALSIVGIADAIGKPITSITVTLLISIFWILVVVKAQEPYPFLTLLFTGIGYGILAIMISGILSPILTGQLQGPLTNPIAFISVLIINAIWGALTGLIATFLLKGKQN